MKTRFQILVSLALSLALVLSLAFSVQAYEDVCPPIWQRAGFSSRQEMMDYYGFSEREYYSLADHVRHGEEAERRCQAWLAAHPREAAAFDPYAYFEEEYGADYYHDPEAYQKVYALSESEFYQQMLHEWACGQSAAEARQQEVEAFVAAHPEAYAAFDPYVHYIQTHGDDDPWAYMGRFELTEEEFYWEMLDDWAARVQMRESVLAREKEAAGGSRDGINVMVNGRCILFPDVKPEVRDGRTMVPAALAMEYLGARVACQPHDSAVLISRGEKSIRHKIGSRELICTEIRDGGRVSEQITMDVPSYVKNDRVMVPVAFFAQALGYEVFWDGEFQTAVLLDRQAAADAIDQNYTVLNRFLYTLTGAADLNENQPGQNRIKSRFELTLESGSGSPQIYSAVQEADFPPYLPAGNLAGLAALGEQLELSCKQLSDRLPAQEQENVRYYQDMLRLFFPQVKTDWEERQCYLRGPLLERLNPEQPEGSWTPIPMAGTPLTVGQLAVSIGFACPDSPFYAWTRTVSNADRLLSVVGDGCFTVSGSDYVLNWGEGLMDASLQSLVHETNGELRIAPKGEKGCTFILSHTVWNKSPQEELSLVLESASQGLHLTLENRKEDISRLSLSAADYFSRD